MPRPVFDMSSEIGRLQAEISRLQREQEPARNEIYLKLYKRISNQDECTTYLLAELRMLQKRVAQLEKRSDELTAAALRLTHNNMDEVREGAQP